MAPDETGSVTEDYGVWVEKSMYGRKYMGIERATFLIDKTGTVARVWHKVKVPGHVEEVLKAFPEIRLAITTVGTEEGRNYARINMKLTEREDRAR